MGIRSSERCDAGGSPTHVQLFARLNRSSRKRWVVRGVSDQAGNAKSAALEMSVMLDEAKEGQVLTKIAR